MMTGIKYDIEKFDGKINFGLWQVRMKALLEQQGLAIALKELPAATIVAYNNIIQRKAYNALILCLGDWVLREITKETTIADIWKKLETLYMTKSLANRLYLKTKLYTFHMHPGKSQSEHIDEFHKLTTEAKGDGGEGLYVKGRYDHGDMNQVSGFGVDEYDSADVMMAMSVKELLDWIIDSGGSYHIIYRRDYLVDFEEYDGGNILLELKRNLISLGTLEKEGLTMKMQSGKIKIIKGSLVVLSGTRRVNCLYTLDGQVVTRKTLKGRKRLEEYQTGYKIKTSSLSKVFWAEDTTMSTYLVNRSPSSAIGFKTPIVLLSNEAAFAVAVVNKIYAHESLNFNNIVASKVISKWKAGLKDDMDARSDVYVALATVLDKAKGNVLGMEIVRDQSGNTVRVSQSRFYNDKSVRTLLDGHSILLLEVSLSGDYDVEKNDVCMMDKFNRGLQIDVQDFVDFDFDMGRYKDVQEAEKL
ncbi:hypothetical protein Tco_0906083 [Tanacetum coccineum]